MTEPTTATATIPREAGQWATVCHIIALVGLLGNGIGFLLGPLIVWLLKREDHPFIDEQGKEAVNFQITMFLAFLVAFFLLFFVIGIVLMPLVVIGNVIFIVLAAVKANEGVAYRYPFAIRFLK